MITVRRADERGTSQTDWLDSRHGFSFPDYHDPRWQGFRALRVLNEDRVRGGSGFGPHPHRDMEIISYVLEGALQHRDSMGTGSVIGPGDVQRMSAGTGVVHSEWNHSASEPVHFLQIWLFPERAGIAPGYEQRAFPPTELAGHLRLLASRNGREGSVTIHQDAALLGARLRPGEGVRHDLPPGRFGWVQMARGAATVNGTVLGPGDGAAASDERRLDIRATDDAEVLVFDLG